MPSNTEIGKAYEYATARALLQMLNNGTLEQSPQLNTAEKSYYALTPEQQIKMTLAALAAVRSIKSLEPALTSNIDFVIKLQTDAQGMRGDVRDVIIEHQPTGFNLGLSCKHNHHAVKHSRLSGSIDFGREWLNLPCSSQYFKTVKPIFYELQTIRDKSRAEGAPALWRNIEDKENRYYKPILNAFMLELEQLDASNPETVPARLIRYLIGRQDFYKVIAEDNGEFTRIEAVNINGTLNNPYKGKRPRTRVPLLSLPTFIYHIGYKRNGRGTSNNTIEIILDNGWTVSMRIHNASSKVEPSLKFDVNLISLPSSIYSQAEPWNG